MKSIIQTPYLNKGHSHLFYQTMFWQQGALKITLPPSPKKNILEVFQP